MNPNQESNQKICEGINQVKADLEITFKIILKKVGSEIKTEKQAEVKQKIEATKQLLDRFKDNYYACTG